MTKILSDTSDPLTFCPLRILKLVHPVSPQSLSHVQLFAIPWTACSPPGSSVPGILQSRILERVAISSFRGSSRPRERSPVSYVFCVSRQIFYHWAIWEALTHSVKWKSLSHVWLFATPWSNTVHGILQVRILEWVAMPFSRGSFWPRDWTQVSCIAGEFFTSWATREALSEVVTITFQSHVWAWEEATASLWVKAPWLRLINFRLPYTSRTLLVWGGW